MVMQGEEMKALRTRAGLSQAGLGEAIGMARETIGAMERGAAPIEKRTELAVRYVTMRPPTGADNGDARAEAGASELTSLAKALRPLLGEWFEPRQS
ncbi:MAG: helix-turn-helix domain-containing protein [Oxalobacteraceae bacterium]|nr:MAG: helix-turn-helix domain-containing protein [Oxalobacteraceae bacterium]